MYYPLVTVFTPIYNTNSKYIIEAIESIRDNNYPNIQHIIIDDFSSNPVPKEEVKLWIKTNNYTCEFYEHKFNYGICKTLNHFLDLSKGKYIFGCSDDVILPNKILTEVLTLENLDETYAATYSDAYLIDGNSNLKKGLFINRNNVDFNYPDDNIFNELLHVNVLCGASMMWKTSCIREVGGYDERLQFEDYDLHLRLFKKYKIKFIKEPLAKYREHYDNHTNRNLDFRYDYFLIYKKHLNYKIANQKIREIKNNVIINSLDINELKKFEVKCPIFIIFLKKIKLKYKKALSIFFKFL